MINLNLGPHQRIVITIDPSPWAARKGATVFTLTLMGRLRAIFFEINAKSFLNARRMRTMYKVQTPTPPAPFQSLKFFPILAYAYN